MARVTISDVAKLAMVDLSTVSRVLNRSFNKHKYAVATIERVQKAAEELGYQPSVAARSLRTGRTMMLGLVVADIGNPFFSEIASHLDNRISNDNYRLMICSTNESPKRQQEHIEGMLAYGVDGLIIAPCGVDGIQKASELHVPLVTIDRQLQNFELPFIGLDNNAAGQLLADKVTDYGNRNIGVVIPEGKTDMTLQSRLEGFKAGLKKKGCTLVWTATIPPTAIMKDEVRSVVMRTLRKNPELPDAIVGMTNVCTIGIIKAMEVLNLNWGDSVSIAGIDDFTAAPVVLPAVTVVSQPLKQIAHEAYTMLVRQIENPDLHPLHEIIHLKPLWIERQSLPDRSLSSF